MSALCITLFGLVLVAQTEATDIVWAVISRPVTLSCDSATENCLLLSPQKKAFHKFAILGQAVWGEQCELKILSVQENDLGEWTCNDRNEVVKVLELTLASQPQSVRLERISETLEARCVVEKAKPRPKFIWYIDDIPLDNINTTVFEDVDIHYQSVYLAPEHVNKKLRCVIDHVSLNEPQEVSIDVKFDAENAIKVSRSSGVFVGFLALISLVAFLTLMLAWAKNWKLFKSEENTAYAVNGEGEAAIDAIQFSQFQNSRFSIRRLSERQLLQNCGYDLEQGHTQSVNQDIPTS